YNGKEEQPMPGKWLDYGWRMYDPALGRFHTQDRFAENSSSWSPYHYANNNPIMNIDVMGDSAWTINNSWNEDYVAQYQSSVQSTIQQYQKDGKEFTCEDLALSVMMDFAESNGLPVTITNGSGTFDARSDDYTDGATFKNDVLTTTAAPDLQNNQNTTTINVNQATSGDIILNRNEEGRAHHTQVVYSPTNDIGVMGIKQGNSGAMNIVPGASRVFGAGNPNSSFYTGKPIESSIYVPAANFYKNYTTGGTISNYSTTKNIVFKRFNFSKF
ncbi:MAG: RHS repeat-associated core domain-containing protein, partial [Ignavibacteria bacterium]|nr:RHS repeat-associated core domain-containing protein [Ignavibacteria bacterium]